MLTDLLSRRALTLTFGLMVAASLAAGGLAIREVVHLQRDLVQIVELHNAKIKLSHEMSAAAHVVSRAVTRLVLLDDPAEIEAGWFTIRSARRRYDAAWAALQAMPASEPSQLRRAGIRTAAERASQLSAQLVELARANRDSEAVALLRQQVGPAAQRWQDAIDDKIGFEESESAADYAAALADFADARNLLIAASALNVAMGLLFGALMARQRRLDRLLRAELKQARDAAETAARTKSAFLANMSHEIRTPMAGVLGIADLLGRTPLDETQRKYVGTIVRSGRSLLALLNDILDLSKVEAGRLTLESRPLDLRSVVQGCVELLAPRASKKGLVLSLDIPDDLPTWVQGDPLRLQQVLNNLIGNAIKFTARGMVRVTVRAAPQCGAGGYCFSVHDTGPGIAAPALARLFQPFAQADDSTARKYGGSGLGLVICRRLAEAMGGTLTVDSQLGAGSTFCLTVALAAAAQPLQRDPADSAFPVDAEPSGGVEAARLAILLVEDNPVNQLYCRAVLEQMGHAVDVAGDGQQAVALAADGRHDLILMDCHMPVLDGYDATRQIRQADARRGAPYRPIFALTAAAMAEDLQRCHDAGMDEVLTKPFRREDLEALLRRVAAAPRAPVTPACS